MAETIEISYSANGQVGPRPRKLVKGDSFRFVCNDPGSLSIEFLGESPLEDGRKTIGPMEDFTASKPGRYKFKCTLTRPNGQRSTLGVSGAEAEAEVDAPAGGEIEVGPGGG